MDTPQGNGHGQIGHPPLWTHTDRKLVAALIWAGKSAAEIGAELHLTRNAVIGRIHRDPPLAQILARRGYPKRRKNSSEPPPKLKPPQPSNPPKLKPYAGSEKMQKRIIEIVYDDWGAWEEKEGIGSRNPKPMIKLKNHECRWPVMVAPHVVGGHLFCAEAVATDGGPYCPHHKERARP